MASLLSLHHLTVLDVSPSDLVTIAATLACDHVCVFTHVPPAARGMFPAVENEVGRRALAARCDATGVGVHNLEYFPIEAGVDLDLYRPGLERGARLGAARATSHINDPEPARGRETFGRLCDLAAEYGLRIGLEFTAFSQVRTLKAAGEVVAAVGRANADVVLDALHLFRSGGTAADVAAIDPARIGYVQICDGPAAIAEAARMAEATGERGVPGTGAFPLPAFLAALPDGPVIDVEVPQGAAKARGVPPLERARRAVSATRWLLEGAG